MRKADSPQALRLTPGGRKNILRTQSARARPAHLSPGFGLGTESRASFLSREKVTVALLVAIARLTHYMLLWWPLYELRSGEDEYDDEA
ncbi:MAG TPA: hypothetical protein VMH92_03450 [Acidocella sp.]|nr:hypothetical protein [Acidocella sp.]